MSPRHPANADSGLLSVVVPVYFNEENLPVTWPALESALAKLPDGWRYEVVFVDDGSGDGSWDALRRIQGQASDRVRLVKLTRNFGQVNAILAGLRAARGDTCAVMSADLQDPPELIPEMLACWRETGRKIVLAVRRDRDDGVIARATSRVFYRLMRRYATPNMPEEGFDFFLLDRQVVDIMSQMDEKNTFIQGQILWTGFEPALVPYRRRKRELGRSRWTLGRKIVYFIDGFATFSVAPIRAMTVLGGAVSLLAFAYAALIFVLRIFWGLPVQGWAPIMISILFLSGVNLVMVGILGEYVWRSYSESRKRPNFVVEELVEDPTAPGPEHHED